MIRARQRQVYQTFIIYGGNTHPIGLLTWFLKYNFHIFVLKTFCPTETKKVQTNFNFGWKMCDDGLTGLPSKALFLASEGEGERREISKVIVNTVLHAALKIS